MKDTFSKKTLGREYAFKFFFRLNNEDSLEWKEKLLTNANDDEVTKLMEEFDNSYSELDTEHPNNQIDPSTKEYSIELIKGVVSKEKELLEQLDKFISKNSINEVNSLEKTILLIGAYEILFVEDAPSVVVINESINMAKKYGSADSGPFVNAILDKLAKEYGK